ncbi:MAG TPA: DUF1648 domain-containing protein [Firmicutes bacterium]|nr:DUF1648 domain-containing protein [Bacillota bacterium]
MQRNKVIFAFLGVFPVLLAALAVNYLPEKVPAHYNFAGEVTRYGSKWEVFILPLITLLIAPFVIWALKSTSKKQAKEGGTEAKEIIVAGYILLVTFNLLSIFFLYTACKRVENLSTEVDYFKLLFSMLGAFFLVMGGVMPKLKRNSIIGLRTKWSLSSDEAWAKSQRFAGAVTAISGILLLLGNIFIFRQTQAVVFSAAVIVLNLIISAAYTSKAAKIKDR